MMAGRSSTDLIPFDIDALSLHGHILKLDDCMYAWIDTRDHPSLHSLSLSTMTRTSRREACTTPILYNNDACNALSTALSTKLKMPVLMSMGQGVDELALLEHIPEIVKTITHHHHLVNNSNK
jgi:proteasome assembly chaperone 4 (PAC4)